MGGVSCNALLLAMESRCGHSALSTSAPEALNLSSQRSSWGRWRVQSNKVTFKSHANWACSGSRSFGEPWKTWISEDLSRGKTPAYLNGFSGLEPKQILEPSVDSMQGNDFSTFAHLDDDECPLVKQFSASNLKQLSSMPQVLPCIGRALLILGLGLSLSMPASARTVAPPTSTVVAGDPQGNKMHGDESAMKREEKATDGIRGKSDAVSHGLDHSDAGSHRQDELKASGQHSGMHSANAPPHSPKDLEDFEEHLRLSEAFWRGIPAPEDSPMYSLKLQLYRYPRDTRALGVLLRAVMEQGDMLRALTILETLLEVQPNELKWKFLKARTHEFLGELSMARKEYEELLSLRPLSARFLQGLVMLLNKLGEGKEALELIQTALNKALTENKDVEARNLGMLLSQFYIQLGNFENALQHLSTMIDEDPDDFRPYLCQGLVYTLMNQKDKAEQNFKKYQQLCPPDSFDQSYLDDLMLKAKTGGRKDAMVKSAMKATFKNKKKPKLMKQPTFSGKSSSGQQFSEDF